MEKASQREYHEALPEILIAWQGPLPGKSQRRLTGNRTGPPEPRLALDFQAHIIPTKIFLSSSPSILSQHFYKCANATDWDKNSRKTQHASKGVPSGYAVRLLLMIVGTGIGREESRMDLGSLWSSVLASSSSLSLFARRCSSDWGYFCSGWILSVSGTRLGLWVYCLREAPSAVSGWRRTHRSCLRLT